MSHSKIASQTQADIHVQGQIDQFFSRFRIGSLLHRCGLRKRNGHSVRSLIQTIFTLPFVGKNFFRGIVINGALPFGKDAKLWDEFSPNVYQLKVELSAQADDKKYRNEYRDISDASDEYRYPSSNIRRRSLENAGSRCSADRKSRR